MNKRTKVNFICIGGQRCGKNTMYTWLEEHPEICTSHEMELNFFTHRWNRGFYWYESHFEIKNKQSILGEMSASYLYDNEAPRRVKKYSKNMKIIISLRDPVSRMMSAFKHSIKVGHVNPHSLDIDEAIKNNPTLFEYSEYSKYLENWFEEFPAENILILNFKNLVEKPHQTYQKLCSFLEIDSEYMPKSIVGKKNSSYIPKSQLPLKVIGLMRKILESLGLKSLVRLIRRANLRNIIDKLNDSKLNLELEHDKKNLYKKLFEDSEKKFKDQLARYSLDKDDFT